MAASACLLASLVAVLPTQAAPLVRAFPGDEALLAWSSNRDGGPDVYVAAGDGSHTRRLTTSPDPDTAPAWSPDGTRIAFVRRTTLGSSDILTMDADGTGVTTLSSVAAENVDPTWSPDGTRIVFASNRTTGRFQLWSVASSGGPATLVVPTAVGGNVRSPSWSPDGASIAYTGNPSGVTSDRLYRADADGTDPVELVVANGIADPDWSPDSTRIAYSAVDVTNEDVFAVPASGGAPTVLVGGPGLQRQPAFSPDGTSLAYAASSDTGTSFAVWRTRLDGSEPATRVTPDDGAVAHQPSWQPGRPIASLALTEGGGDATVGTDHDVVVTALDTGGTQAAGRRIRFEVVGDPTQTGVVLTGAEGRARFTTTRADAGPTTVLACADVDLDDVCGPSEPAVDVAVLWVDPDGVDEPRLAFTDDADALYAVDVLRTGPGAGARHGAVTRPRSVQTGLEGFEPGPAHEGEAGGVPGQLPAFVSSRDDPAGEVYLAREHGSAERVTCDPGRETHPVVNGNGEVAYASDADGDWDVYVSSPPPPGRVAPFGQAPPVPSRATACGVGWTTVNLTDDLVAGPDDEPTDELWPTWTYDATNDLAGVDGVAFSSAVPDALPDLVQLPRTGTGWGAAIALTSTPDVAETQPAAMVQSVFVDYVPGSCGVPDGDCIPIYEDQDWLAFTTTERTASGTIAFLSPSQPGVVTTPDDADTLGTEPAWSSVLNPRYLAVTTTADDPYGDIAIGFVAPATAEQGLGTSPPDVVTVERLVTPVSGVGESHPFWRRPYTGDSPLATATLFFTSRAQDVVRAGSRLLHADVADVRASDGSQRRPVRRGREVVDGEVRHRYDEAGPAYSPDGREIVYSTDGGTTGAQPDVRVLMRADADGSDARPLLPAGGRQGLDTDVDPVWSPDGTRVAFTRVRGFEDAPSLPPQLWLHDLEAGTVTRVPGGPAGDPAVTTLTPSWAPDSRHVVVERANGGSYRPFPAARRWGRPPPEQATDLVLLDTSDPTAPPLELDSCADGCRPAGRHPAWSPDGTTIAYEYQGQLRSFEFVGPCCDERNEIGLVPIVDDQVLVGSTIDFGPLPRPLTPSRRVVAAAQDPAWSPDGTEIAFSGQPVGQPDDRNVYAIAPDGSGLRQVTDEPSPETEPAWQVDREADLSVTVTVAPTSVLVGDTLVATFTMRNDGPTPAYDPHLSTSFGPGAVVGAVPGGPAGCRADGTGCDLARLDPGEVRVYQVRVTHPTPVTGTATGTIVAAEPPDPDLADNVDSALYRVRGRRPVADVDRADVAVRIELDRSVGYVGGLRTATVTVRNLSPDPADDVRLRATWPTAVAASGPAPPCLTAGNPCLLGGLAPGEVRLFTVGLEMLAGTQAPVTLGARVSTTTSETTLVNNADEVRLRIRQPSLRVLPGVAPPGRVVLAYGEDMPPGSDVDLTWLPGITIDPGPFRVAADGTVRVPLLVVRHDLLGVRLLTATSVGGLFTPVDAELLVVPRTLAPPSFNGRG
ncbi:hypothetical protein ABFT23_21330 [Nocardioides sp. C4-1]|uniref:hypothetical protein n=1 Tax=Nocardioides sp. C4-1 TaxID=3151851 RepID=UPI003265ECD1